MQVREAPLALKNIAPVLRQVSPKDVVEITSGHQLFHVDLDKTEDEEPIDDLTTSFKSFLALCSKNKKILRCSHQRSKQVNEIKCLKLKVGGWC